MVWSRPKFILFYFLSQTLKEKSGAYETFYSTWEEYFGFAE